MAAAAMSSTNDCFEIEEKFEISNITEVETQLENLGMKLSKKKEFIDWYFDTEPPTLTPKDVWLRFRSNEGEERGNWELKRGVKNGNNNSPTDRTTVYEEIVGEDGVKECFRILSSIRDTSSNNNGCKSPSSHSDKTEFEGYTIPKFPSLSAEMKEQQEDLKPFCRLETQRSSWTYPPGGEASSSSLTVDLDVSNYGYAVGEVELVVTSQDDIPQAKSNILEFLKKLQPTTIKEDNDYDDDNKAPFTLGKLSHYLLKYRPEHLQLCMPNIDVSKLKIP